MQPDSRRCTKCAVEKPLSEFSKNPRGKYGRKPNCKACDAARHATLHPPKPRVRRPLRAPVSPDEPKECRKCGVTKTYADFSLSRKATETANAVYRSDCKECCSARALQWFHDNKERHKETKHRWNLANIYGLTAEQYQAMFEAQGGVCAICGQAETKKHGRTGTEFRLAVDHCHETGRVRGLLCQTCNRVVGLFKDDIERHRKAIEYLLRNHPEKAE